MSKQKKIPGSDKKETLYLVKAAIGPEMMGACILLFPKWAHRAN